jgi:hypothetical protein
MRRNGRINMKKFCHDESTQNADKLPVVAVMSISKLRKIFGGGVEALLRLGVFV